MNETVNQPIPPSPTHNSLPSIANLLRTTFSFYRSNLYLLLGIISLPFLISVIQIFTEKSTALYGLLVLLGYIVTLISILALIIAVTHEGQTTLINSYKKALRRIVPFIWLGILSGLIVWGGTLLFIIPGIIFTILLLFGNFILIAENRRGISALTTSWHYVDGYWWPLAWRIFLFQVIFLIILLILNLTTNYQTFLNVFNTGATIESENSLIGQLLPLAFNIFIVSPLMLIYSYKIYISLKSIKTEPPSPLVEKKRKKIILVFLVIGIIGILIIVPLFAFMFHLVIQGYSATSQL